MNVELCRKALEKVGDPRILVNLVSRRVRQLNGGGGYSRPLIDPDPTYGTADIALQEIVDDKITWEYVGAEETTEAEVLLTPKRRRKAAAPAPAPSPAPALEL